MSAHLRHDHELLLGTLLNGRLPRSLTWPEVVELVSHIGEVLPRGGNEFLFVVDGQKLAFTRPHHDEFEMEETARLRNFLREARSSQTPAASSDSLIFVVIDHHAAHIYRYARESDPGAETSITPYDPFGFHRHLIHRKETHYSGDRVPEETSYYREIAAELGHEGQIIVVGHAKGKSSAMEHLLQFLEKHHADLFKRVIETEVLDLSALTEPEIEAIVNKRMSNS